MSKDNVEIVRLLQDEFRRGDWNAVVERFDPEVELDQSQMPDGAVYRGRDDLIRFYRRWLGSWESFEILAGRVIEAGNRVLVLHTVRGQAKGSGVTVEMSAADLYTLRNGRVVAMQGYTNQTDALRAVGLNE